MCLCPRARPDQGWPVPGPRAAAGRRLPRDCRAGPRGRPGGRSRVPRDDCQARDEVFAGQRRDARAGLALRRAIARPPAAGARRTIRASRVQGVDQAVARHSVIDAIVTRGEPPSETTGRRGGPSTMRITEAGDAPSAMRRPTSLVRYATTPTSRPLQALALHIIPSRR